MSDQFNESDVVRDIKGQFAEQRHGEPAGLVLDATADGDQLALLEAALAEGEDEAARLASREADLLKEAATLATSDKHPLVLASPRRRREQLDRIGDARKDVAAEAERLYRKAGAQYPWHLANDMLAKVTPYRDTERLELRTRQLRFKVKKSGSDAEATQRAHETARTDPAYLAAVKTERKTIAEIQNEEAQVQEAYRACAEADRRRYELQKETRSVTVAREAAERRVERARFDLEHAQARQDAGISEHAYADPRKADPGLTVNEDGTLNAWVYRDGRYLRAVHAVRNDGNVRPANKLILEDGTSAVWGSHWSRSGPLHDESRDAGVLLTAPPGPDARPLAEVTGAAGLWCETDSSD